MLNPGFTFVSYNWYNVRNKFLELTGWEDDDSGLWNCKFNKEVTFTFQYDEGHFFSHEQDYIYFDPFPEDTISLDQWHNKNPKNIAPDHLLPTTWKYDGFIYDGHTVLLLPYGIMLKYLRDLGELPKDIPIIVSSWAWAEPL